ncbi:hypothetical protein PLICRDRAFT_108997 [Plicaturopsis crispa FD-325 SS-3]|nr:hypothetical protein PLICRDRAFT_108997 [Plicaturopsis crispa FD-325 SS-3]
MEKSRSQSDVPGYIYTFEIRGKYPSFPSQQHQRSTSADPSTPARVQLKVGRAVNLVKRIDQWGKQCGSKEQILRGWWPGTVEADDGSLVKGRVKAGDKGLWCHRLERLVHLELADLSENAVYFDPGFPNTAAKVVAKGKGAASGSPKKAGPKAQDKACADCGAYHKEIFTFKRATRGRYAGKEWELLVKPIIEKWGAFVEAYV